MESMEYSEDSIDRSIDDFDDDEGNDDAVEL